MGIVLYELVTGEKPFDADTPMGLMIQKVEKSVPSPRECIPELPVGVELLILAATAKNAWDRLSSASLFSEALRGMVGEEVTFSREVLNELGNKGMDVSRLRWGFLLAGFAILGAFILGVIILSNNTKIIDNGRITPSRVSSFITIIPSVTGTFSVPTKLSSTITSSPVQTLTPQHTQTIVPTFTPTRIPTFRRELITEENIQNIQLLYAFNQSDSYSYNYSFSPDGLFLIQISGNGKLSVLATNDWQQIFSQDLVSKDLFYRNYWGEYYGEKILFSPDASQIAIADATGIDVRNTSDWKMVYQLKVGPREGGYFPLSIAISPNGYYLVSLSVPDDWNPDAPDKATFRNIIQIWRLLDGELLHELQIFGDVNSPQFSPDCQLLFIPINYSNESSLVRSGYTRDYFHFNTVTQVIRLGDASLRAILGDEYTGTFSSDSHLFAGKYLWDISGCPFELESCGRQISQLRNPGWRFDSQNTFYDDNRLYTTVGRIWQTRDGRVLYTIEEVPEFWDSVVTPDHQLMIIGSRNELIFYDLKRLQVLFDFPGVSFSSAYPQFKILSPDGSLIATSQEGLLRVRRTSDGRVVYTFEGMPGVLSVNFSPDGKYLIALNQPSESNWVLGFWGLPSIEK
jgi:hypothetical protein